MSRYKLDKVIIPLGFDCHAAHILKTLNIRRLRFPFDWLNGDPVKSMWQVVDCINTDFYYFFKNLTFNLNKNVVSERYSFSEFVHHRGVIVTGSERDLYIKRIESFRDFLDKGCYYLYCIPNHILTKKNAEEFVEHTLNLKGVMNDGQTLCIYIRFDGEINKEEEGVKILIESLSPIDNVNITTYSREKDKHGIWGNKYEYPDLLRSLNINLTERY